MKLLHKQDKVKIGVQYYKKKLGLWAQYHDLINLGVEKNVTIKPVKHRFEYENKQLKV